MHASFFILKSSTVQAHLGIFLIAVNRVIFLSKVMKFVFTKHGFPSVIKVTST